MITSIELKNFQSHRHSRLQFHPGVNVIIGTSDSGKTAIIRGLRWLVWNRPLGSSFRSNWGGPTSINLFAGSTNVYREKDKTDFYQLNDTEFRAFGTDVPSEIQEALNISEVNLQRQLDQPFLISESPGEVAQHFNRVANLDQIDISMKSISSLVRSINQQMVFYQEEKQRLEEELVKYDILDKIEIDLEILEDLDDQIKQQKQANKELLRLLEKEKETRQQIDHFVTLLSLEEDVLNISAQLETKKVIQSRVRILKDLVDEIEKIQAEQEELHQLIENEETVKGLLATKLTLDAARTQSMQLSNLLQAIKRTKSRINLHETKTKELTEKFNTLFPDICPLCGTPKDKVHATH